MKELKGKVAVVTGGAGGLGRAMAMHFAREGMHVALADIDQASLDVTAAELRSASRPSAYAPMCPRPRRWMRSRPAS